MNSAIAIRDYSRSVGTTFYAYHPDQMAAIIKAWAEAPWPLTMQEAFTLRDQCGWTASPGCYSSFCTPVSDGEPDGHILVNYGDQSLTSGVDVMVTTRAQLRFEERTAAITGSIYREYLSAFLSLYGRPKEEYEETGLYVDWILQNGSSVFLSPGSTFIEVYVRSPEATVDAILN